VRWASNPMKLPKSEVIGLVHTQPFVHGRWLFAHNGTLYIPREVRAALGDWNQWIQGNNDSEVLFYWLLKHLPFLLDSPSSGAPIGRIVRGVRQSLNDLDAIWRKCRKNYPIYKFP